MRKDIEAFVQKCPTCQQAKSEHCKLPGLLKPLPIPPEAWHTVSLDFIEGLPQSYHYDTILVIIDKLTKYGHFIPLKHPYSAVSVARLFLDNIYKLHGLPKTIISDRDKIFISTFWRQLFKMADTTLNLSSSYHPQTDGQTERLNQCLETYLRCMVHANPNKWSAWLPQAEYWYNTNFHSSLGKSPFEVLYGHKPRHFGIQNTLQPAVTDVEHWLQERQALLPIFRQHLERAQQRMCAQADKKRMERQFSVGEQVYLKLQPYVQTSVALRSSQKLAFRFFGPFKILKRVGSVAYKLQLPDNARIHPVVHVSQLKKAVSGDTVVSQTLPSHEITNRLSVQPCAVIDERFVKRGRKMAPQVKLQWDGLPETCATWEYLYAVVEAFPDAPAWGQAGTREGGIVTTHDLPRAQAVLRRAARRQEIRKAHEAQKKKAQAQNHEVCAASTEIR
jgi:hypothetical protein